MPCEIPPPGFSYQLDRVDPAAQSFRPSCSEAGDQTQPCGQLLWYVARRSDGRSRVLCCQHAARFAARHSLPFPVPA